NIIDDITYSRSSLSLTVLEDVQSCPSEAVMDTVIAKGISSRAHPPTAATAKLRATRLDGDSRVVSLVKAALGRGEGFTSIAAWNMRLGLNKLSLPLFLVFINNMFLDRIPLAGSRAIELGPDELKDRLLHHKYAAGEYTPLDMVFMPFWNACTDVFPRTISPNAI
ncbi:hypothetical protein FOZ62_014504, partial [Perkinsus olseni]